MASILQEVKLNMTVTSNKTRKYKQDIELASEMLGSVKNMTHGLFLGQGGSYNKRLYKRNIIKENAKVVPARSTKLVKNVHETRNVVETFLSNLNHSSMIPKKEVMCTRMKKPKKKNESFGSVVVMAGNKIKIKLINGNAVITEGPIKAPYYNPAEIFCSLQDNVDQSLHNMIMKVLSTDKGCGMVP
eukprot:5147879-Ditylum_brightwellii.AAC.1